MLVPLLKLTSPHYPVLSSALHLSLSEMIYLLIYFMLLPPIHIPPSAPALYSPGQLGNRGLCSHFLGVPYMFSGLWVVQLTPLLTGVSAVSTVLRVLRRKDGPRVSVVFS